MKLYLIILLTPIYLFSQIIYIDNSKSNQNIEDKILIYTNSKTKDFNTFIKEKNDLSRGIYSKYDLNKLETNNIWLEFTIKNKSNKYLSKYLYFTNHALNHIALFYSENNGKKELTKGIDNYQSFDYSLNPYFKIEFEATSSKTYYLNINSTSSSLESNILLFDEKALFIKETKHQVILAIFIGTIITFILYNLILFLFTKQLSYAFYTLYFTTFIMHYIYYTNMYLYIFNLPINFVGLYILAFMTIFILLFTKQFLQVKNHKKINLLFNILILLILIFILLMFINKYFYSTIIAGSLYLLALLCSLVSSYYLLFIGNKNAKYIVIGWTIALMGYLIFALENFNLIKEEDFLYIYEFSIFLEALLFSIALAAKLNKTKELENMVQRNKVLTKELHHRIKNNMQFIISLYRLKLSTLIDNKIKEKVNEVELTIQSMSKIHEMLYNQKGTENLNVYNYFKILIGNLKNTSTKNIEYNLEIQSELDLSKLIFCGIIINELITNSIKYAFKDKGKITIKLKNEGKKTIFEIKDNGIGFKQKEIKKESFGLLLVKTLVENDLKGNFIVNSEKGTHIKIIF